MKHNASVGSTRFSAPASLLESRSTHAMAFIRERALQEDPEEEAAYEETPSKRQCSAYLRAADLPREMFQHPPPLPVSFGHKLALSSGRSTWKLLSCEAFTHGPEKELLSSRGL